MIRIHEGFLPEMMDLDAQQRRIIGEFWDRHLEEIHVEYALSDKDRRFVVLYKLREHNPNEACTPPPRNFYLKFVEEINPIPGGKDVWPTE